MTKTVVIALAGVDKEDLHKAKWAEIPQQGYVDAARFCIEHNAANVDMSLNEGRARELFADSGSTRDVVLQQAVKVVTEGELKHRLEGPQTQDALV